MADLEILRPEVHGLGPCKVCGATGYPMSFGGPDICPACDCGVNPDVTRLKRELAEARAELLRLATIEADALIALDCEHDWQVEHKRAEKAEAELAAIKARIGASRLIEPGAQFPVPGYVGKRVRMLVED